MSEPWMVDGDACRFCGNGQCRQCLNPIPIYEDGTRRLICCCQESLPDPRVVLGAELPALGATAAVGRRRVVKRALAIALLVLAGCSTAQSPPQRAPEPTTTLGPATAICEDGSVSWARSRRGACSGHGGVAHWYGSGGP